MKRIGAILMATVVLMMLVVPFTANAARNLTAGEKSIFDKLEKGVKFPDGTYYTIPQEIIDYGRNYLLANYPTPLTQEKVDQINAKIDAAGQKALATKTSISEQWDKETRNFILQKIDESLQIVDTDLHAKGNTATQEIDIVKTGVAQPLVSNKLLTPLTTGTDSTAFVVAGACGIALLVATVVVSKKVKLF